MFHVKHYPKRCDFVSPGDEARGPRRAREVGNPRRDNALESDPARPVHPAGAAQSGVQPSGTWDAARRRWPSIHAFLWAKS